MGGFLPLGGILLGLQTQVTSGSRKIATLKLAQNLHSMEGRTPKRVTREDRPVSGCGEENGGVLYEIWTVEGY